MTGYQSKKAAAQDKLEQEPASVTYKEVQDSMNALEKGDLRQQVIAEELGQRKLYTTPPQRQPLTDDEIWKFWWSRPEVPEGEDDSMEAEFVAAVRAVLAAHDIKENT